MERQGPGSITLTYDFLKWSIPTLKKFPRDRGCRIVMFLGQEYVLSREFHILRNPGSDLSPRHPVYKGGGLNTPEWRFVHPAPRRYGPAAAVV